MTTRPEKSVDHQRGSTNVYADLGYKSADEMLVKAQLVTTIADILAERKLMDCLTRLGRDIDIVVRSTPKRKGQGAVSVSFV